MTPPSAVLVSDGVAIALTTLGYSLAAGAVGLVVGYLLRRRSLRVATIGVALVAVCVVLVGLFGTSRAMFISGHDLRVAVETSLVAGLVGLGLAVAVGENLVRRSRDVQEEARRFGRTGTFTAPGDNLPRELAVLSQELERASDRLAEARELRERTEASRRELVAWVSHDLRTPLAGLRAMAEALEDGMVDDPGRYHARIAAEVERMGRMVDDLFQLSRLEAGVFELATEPVPVRALVDEVLAVTEPVARARGVRLDRPGEADSVVDADPLALRRVLLNLLSNAVRHTPADGAVVLRVQPLGSSVEVSVGDACGGIAEEDLPRVFDLGWRGSAARTPEGDGAGSREGSGAGLGLAIARGVVEAHGGTVAVANHGTGCRFTVVLPTVSA